MKISRDTAYREQLLENQRLRMGIGVRRSGVHVSDLVFCVRKAQQERQAAFAEEVTDETILTWLRGLSHEALLADGVEQVRSGFCFQCMKNYPWTPELAIDSKCPDCGDELLVGTIDWVTLEGLDDETQTIDNFIPVEMKSTLKSSKKTLEDGEMAWFIDQIKSYMFMQGRKEGRICILHVMGDYSRGNPDIKTAGPKADLRVYHIEWDNDEEALAWGQELQWSKEDVEGDALPELNERSPRHDFICEYCVIGKRLPSTGEPCENYPWTADGIRKGSALAGQVTADTLDNLLKDIEKMAAQQAVDKSDQITGPPILVDTNAHGVAEGFMKGGPPVKLAGVKLTPEQQKALADQMANAIVDERVKRMDAVLKGPTPTVKIVPSPLSIGDVERATRELERIRYEHERERQQVMREALRELERQLLRRGDVDANARTGSSTGSAPGKAGSTTGGQLPG